MSLRKGLLVAVTAIIISSVLYISYWAYQFRHTSFKVDQTLKVYPHTHLRHIANILQQRHLWQHPHMFELLGRWYGFAGQLRFGEYHIRPTMTPFELLQNIHHANGLVKHSFRIHEGWTAEDLVLALHQDGNIRFKPIKQPLTQLEGMAYPDTYQFAWGVSSQQVVRYAEQKMQAVLQKIWDSRDHSIPITTPYQALIVASLIQTEAARVDERPKVAAVIYNRLRKKMRLQIDPTVMFGLRLPYGSVLTKQQLNKKTPYNTYTIEGLPPTPIAFPTYTAIYAACHPASLDAYYYVANGDGTHTFSKNYKTHRQAVTRYRDYLNEEKWQDEKQALEVVVEEGL